MHVRLAYGDDGLLVDLPDDATVIEPVWRPGVADVDAALRQALTSPVDGPPLREVVHPGQTVAISVCDGTRAQPRRPMLEAVLDQLDGIVPDEAVVVLVATGTHRGNTPAELSAMLGPELLGRVRVVNHDARDADALRWMGRFGADVPVWLNREWVDADVRITTGFVEPHFFAGFSGGPKMVAPGLAGLDTVLVLHDARRIGHPMARWGVTVGNPVHDDVRAIAEATGVDFAFDVLLNAGQEVVAAYAGRLPWSHARACEAARSACMRAVRAPFDVVVTTNSGFPLDQNLYQAVKGLSAAAQVVKQGGTIVAAAECRDGFPAHGEYRSMLASGRSLPELLDDIERRPVTVPDQWQAQIQAKVQAKARVVMHTSGLSPADLAAAHLGHTDDVAGAVRAALAGAGAGATLCVLPEGPQTVPYLEARG